MQENYAVDPKTLEEIRAFVREFDRRFNNNDAVAVAALFTEDAIQIGPEGPIRGRKAIVKKSEEVRRLIPAMAPHRHCLYG